MFQSIETAPQDPILGLGEAFQRETNPAKINLSVGVYQDAAGRTPILDSVKQAEARLLAAETSKGYLGIAGSPKYAQAVQELLFGEGSPVVTSGRTATSHTPGGTGALRVAADFIKKLFPTSKVWLSTPTWPNHPSIFTAAGLEVGSYPYYDEPSKGLALEPLLAALGKLPAGDVVLLHGCCHNPTGIDPTPEQWAKIAAVVRDRQLLPLVDFAYQGFATGLREDAAALEALCTPGSELLICSSFSKNFGLYCERVGAITLVAASADAANAAQSQMKTVIRANYSNPPAHGAAIVTTILADPALRKLWESELAAMRDRINGMRRQFVAMLKAKQVPGDFSFIADQKGMFSFSGLNPDQVKTLRDKYAIYIVGSGRINVAGMTEQNLGPLCDAIKAVS